MTLPPIAETPSLVVRFTSKATERLRTLCQERWKECGLVVLSQHHVKEPNNATLVFLTATQHALEVQAERLRLLMRTNDTQVMEYFTLQEKHRFCHPPSKKQEQQQQLHMDSQGLFTARDRAFLILRIFRSVTVLDDSSVLDHTTHDKNPLCRLLQDEFHADFCVHLDVLHSQEDGLGVHTMEEHADKSDTLWHVLTSCGLVDVMTCIHQPALRDLIVAKTTLAPLFHIYPDVDLIQDYLGHEVGFYFAWIGFLTKWYFFPGILGLLVYGLRIYRGDTIDEDELVPFYGLVCFFWAIFFLRFWEREENRLAWKWGTFGLSNYERNKFFATRPEFRGYLRKSPVTDEYEVYYPPFRRRLKYVLSAIVTIAMLAVAFGVMILSLNLQGYINPKNNPERWHANNPHPFHFPALAVLAEEGNLLDAKSSWRSLIPVVLHVVCISTLNSIYRMIAERLTHFENHETEVAHTNSVVVKRFLFEAFDCYVALFYLAFWERNVDRLRAELVGIFQIDTLRRVLLECIVPTLLQSVKQGHFVLPKSWNAFAQRPASLQDVLEEIEKDEYDQFDDYMEMVIQLGYVTLFASAYPLASLLAILANWVEIRTDALKIARLVRRPDIHRSAGLGMWRHLIAILVWMSALTNCLIAGFTSDQLMQLWPSFYLRNETGYTDMGHERGWIAIFLIFGLEHVLLIMGFLIYVIVPAVPEDVQDALERRQFLRLKERDTKRRDQDDKKTQ